MSSMLVAQAAAESLFLDRLGLVAREPLTYVAFLMLILA
jgi:hypothetical protein